MCGISGFIDFSNSSSKEDLVNMTDILSHRGPDGAGYDFFQEENYQVGLGHRRLSVIDLSEKGRQPMYSVNGNYGIVFNGEVYNFTEIRKWLVQRGYSFNSETDTEVILNALIEEGVEAVNRMIGMFAIVFYDKGEGKIHLIRDRAGVKPLYYTLTGKSVLFASEIKSLHKHHHFNASINNVALGEFLDFGYTRQDRSIFKDVYSVLPGEAVTLDLNKKSKSRKKYWNVYDHYESQNNIITYEDALEKLEQILKEAFQFRMVSDVPVGVFLSGGIDSSTVAAMLQKTNSKSISTFTIGFESKQFDEATKAKKIATYLGTNHHELYCSENELLDIFPKLCEIFDEPFADKSAIPTVLLSQFARKHVTVALSADGGDELFAGYNKYFTVLNKLSNHKQFGLKQSLYNLIYEHSPGLPNRLHSKAYAAVKYANDYPNSVSMLISGARTFGRYDLQHLLLEDYSEHTIDSKNLDSDSLSQIQAYDYTDYLPNDILVKVDRATMSVGLEGRDPLLDHRITEFVAALPSQFKYHDGITKRMLKDINHKYLPSHLTEGPKKGFSIPKKQWLEQHLKGYVDHYLSDEIIRKGAMFNPRYIKRLKRSFDSGGSHNRVWNVLIFNMWLEKWIGFD